jgi:plasmid stabilization system protein ParE
MQQAIILRTTLTQLVAAWRQSEQEIRQGFALLATAKARLKEQFRDTYRFSLEVEHVNRRYSKADDVLKELKKEVWSVLVDRMELRRVLSVARAQELDRQLQSGEGLPDIDEAQVLAMMEGILCQVHTFIEEAVKEVFDYLRPPHSAYKTNTEFEVGKRVILTWAVERKYNGGFQTNHHREQNIRGIDNVFHALDGNGTVHTHRGPLIDAINQCGRDGKGEPPYFKFKCFRNRNLHLEFKRLDLVAKLNQVAGGMRLKPQPAAK